MKKIPTVLCILDGFGLNSDYEANAVRQARTENFTRLWNDFPHQELITHGERVGLPAGQMGNSEVGHLNIGAGRVVEQWLTRINRILREEALPSSPSYQRFVAENGDRDIHIVGLVSNGGVHSHIDHLLLFLKQISNDVRGSIFIHVITDGRDTAPQSGVMFISALQTAIAIYPQVRIASVVGRFYAMDRDTRWERVEKSYSLLTEAKGEFFPNALEAMTAAYNNGTTDEFIEPISLGNFPLKQTDAVIFFNFRQDRMKELVTALTQNDFNHFGRNVTVPPPQTLCFTEYDKTYDLPVLFDRQPLDHHLGEVVSNAGKNQIRIAETEKYPHVTYFMNGKVETPYEHEDRVMVPSPRDVKTYDLKPEMSAKDVAAKTAESISSGDYDLIVVNFANCDMVGHCGNLQAAIAAVEVVDECLGTVISALESANGQLVVIADHGNAEQMIHYDTREPHTAHTTYHVPVVVAQFGTHKSTVAALHEDKSLCDIAPTLLELMNIQQPELMTGRSIIKHHTAP